MTKDEALRLAWGALEDIGDEWGFTSQRTVPKRKEAITAIKEALANEALEKMAENARELGLDYEPAQPEHGWTPERIAGMARLKEAQDKKLAQPEQEPVAFASHGIVNWIADKQFQHEALLYSAPQRTWVGLTDIDYAGLPLEQVGLVRWAEAKLKEKNT